jgi:hypothetical protein
LLAILAFAALGAHGSGADELGTLFTTPGERARLDKLRRGEPIERAAVPGAPGGRALTGFVQRSDGRTTVWIDGDPVTLAAPRNAPKLDPKSVRAYSEDPDGVKVERKTAR